MYLSHLRLENFRNLSTQDIALSNDINLITGANGSGKSSLLEGIYFLGRSRSFRTNQYKHIIQYQQPFFRLIGKTQQPNHLIGLERGEKSILRLDRKTQKNSAEVAHILPTIAITSHSFALIDSGPAHRRQFIDYGAFHLQPGFFQSWLRYQKALKNRNLALRKQLPKAVIRSYDPLIINHGIDIHAIRLAYFETLKPLLSKHLTALNFPFAITLRYSAGWNTDLHLSDSLDKHFDYDLKLKHTRYGPHRADIGFYTDEASAGEQLSRGQQKSLIIALYLAQIDLIRSKNSHSPILIIDDIAAELDVTRRQQIYEHLTTLDCQVCLSATDPALFDLDSTKTQTLHVDNGVITTK